MQVFVDMDGVLADFDTGYANLFGPHGGKDSDDVDWKKVRDTPGFYASLPPMPDFDMLWRALEPYHPIILTGVPLSVPEASENKRAWAVRHIGPDVRMICCKSRDKCLHGKPGDVLIDDWGKYKQRWVDMGGYWITHSTAVQSIRTLQAYMLKP
jgi:hypothetical protein